MSSCSLQPVSKYFSFFSSTWIIVDNGTTKRQFAHTWNSSFLPDGPLFTLLLLLKLCDQIINQNEFLFILNWNEAERKRAVERNKKKILVEWLIKLDIDKYCMSWWGHPLTVQTQNIILYFDFPLTFVLHIPAKSHPETKSCVTH